MVNNEKCLARYAIPVTVGASLLAMVVNDNACVLTKRGALESIASRLAPTTTGHPAFFASFVSPLSQPPPKDL
jgi:hypothetical protein